MVDIIVPYVLSNGSQITQAIRGEACYLKATSSDKCLVVGNAEDTSCIMAARHDADDAAIAAKKITEYLADPRQPFFQVAPKYSKLDEMRTDAIIKAANRHLAT